jgi:uncharacterized membrane protein YozB (DUF420 family)
MNSELLELTMRYSSGWCEAVWQRSLLGLFGAAILLLVVRAIVRKNTGLIAILLWAVLGLFMAVFAAFPEAVINTVVNTEYMTRIRVVMGGVSVFVLLITFESIRKTHLQERYALLWVTTALVMLLGCFFPDAVTLFRAVTGMQYGAAMAAVAFVFLSMVSFHFSISLSSLQSKQSQVAQRVAILEERIRELESKAE